MADLRKVPVFDWQKGEFVIGVGNVVRTATGQDAVGQVAIKAQQTQRGKYSIYADFENKARNHVYGSDVHDILVRQELPEAVRFSEVERASREALVCDPWIDDVTDIAIYKKTDADGVVRLYEDMVLHTPFGTIPVEGVQLNGG